MVASSSRAFIECKGRHIIPFGGSLWDKAQLGVLSELLFAWSACDGGGKPKRSSIFCYYCGYNAKCVSEPKLLLQFERTAPVWDKDTNLEITL